MRGVAKSIQQLLCINVTEEDPLPKTVCTFCLNRVDEFREFHASCLSASHFLHLKLPSVEEASGRCYVSVNGPVRPACFRRKAFRHLKAPIDTAAVPSAASEQPEDDQEEDAPVEVREYEECVQQPNSASENYTSNDILQLFEDTVDTDYFNQDHDYMSIDPSIKELLTPKKLPVPVKNFEKVMAVQDHDYLSAYENPMTPSVVPSLGPFADNLVNLLDCKEQGEFIEHNYFLPSVPSAFEAEKPVDSPQEEAEEVVPAEEEQCELCGSLFVSFDGHDCSADFERQCETCGSLFQTNADFSAHECANPDVVKGFQQAESENLVQCEECGSFFRVSSHHDCLADYDRQCDKCGKLFQTNSLFQEHGCFVPGQKTCDFCRKKFRSRTKLKRHLLKAHLAVRKGPFRCNICYAVYTRRAFFSQHMHERHFKNPKLKLNFEISSEPRSKRIQCRECGKNFSSNSSLALHRRLHTKAYSKFTCEICNLRFLKQLDYCKHVSAHLVQHKFPCDECHKGFETKKQWDNHKVRHSANRKIRAVQICRKENSDCLIIKSSQR
ncbi:Hypothetical predicted protein [Cloeon dipterum]|uniref:Protein krueppel n=1 Tax=Cloeon dipterum TaxID=197152 RepID=A0A8S1CYY0_9INSE|nr:Hypothetical predicted protein [Cloeon dipterum]